MSSWDLEVLPWYYEKMFGHWILDLDSQSILKFGVKIRIFYHIFGLDLDWIDNPKKSDR